MDVFTISKTPHPGETVPSYSSIGSFVPAFKSMIWVERHKGHGSFELKTHNIKETLAALPLMSFIGIQNSRDVMMVETHVVDKDAENKQELTVTGRSLTAFLEHRNVDILPNQSYWLGVEDWDSYLWPRHLAASLFLWEFLVNPTSTDATRPGIDLDHGIDQAYWRDITQTVPNVAITNSNVWPATANFETSVSVVRGEVWKQIDDVLSLLPRLGVRVIRPPSYNAYVVDFYRPTASEFPKQTTVIYSFSEQMSKLRFDVYGGLDRSLDQTDWPPIVFDFNAGVLGPSQYVFSSTNYKTYIKASNANTSASRLRDLHTWTGWDLRTALIDAGDLQDIPEDVPKLFKLIHLGLADTAIKKVADVDLLANSSIRYGIDYDLGDVVTVLDEFNQKTNMRITEYTRSSGVDGDREYPTLAMLD